MTNEDWSLPLTYAFFGDGSSQTGRIQYSSGDTESAVRLFLGLLRYSVQVDTSDTDSVVIDDFHQALEVRHFIIEWTYPD